MRLRLLERVDVRLNCSTLGSSSSNESNATGNVLSRVSMSPSSSSVTAHEQRRERVMVDDSQQPTHRSRWYRTVRKRP